LILEPIDETEDKPSWPPTMIEKPSLQPYYCKSTSSMPTMPLSNSKPRPMLYKSRIRPMQLLLQIKPPWSHQSGSQIKPA
jgi:hypothetical protein